MELQEQHYDLEKSAVTIGLAPTTSSYDIQITETCYELLWREEDERRLIVSFMMSGIQGIGVIPRFLRFRGDHGLVEEVYTKEVWQAVLSVTPSVNHILIQGKVPLGPFVAALQGPNLLCPALTILEIEDQGKVGDPEGFDAMLKYREELGANIRTVRIDHMEV